MKQNEINKRYDWIDTARGLGIILVLFGHIDYPYITDWIYTFHIPLIFFVSGIVFNYNKSVKVFIRDEFKRLVIPYYFWALLFFVLPGVIIDFITGNGLIIPTEYIQFLYMGRLDTIWYLSALMIMHIISYAVLKLSKGNGFALLGLSVILFCAFCIYYRNGGKNLWFNIDAACMGILFFSAGYVISKKTDIFSKVQELSLKKKFLYFICFLSVNITTGEVNYHLSGSAVNMFKNRYDNPILMIISAFFGISAAVMLSLFIKSKPLRYIGQNSMPYFIMHQRLYIYTYAYLYTLIGFDRNANLFNQTINFILLPIVISALITVFNMIVVRIAPLSFILGMKRKR